MGLDEKCGGWVSNPHGGPGAFEQFVQLGASGLKVRRVYQFRHRCKRREGESSTLPPAYSVVTGDYPTEPPENDMRKATPLLALVALGVSRAGHRRQPSPAQTGDAQTSTTPPLLSGRADATENLRRQLESRPSSSVFFDLELAGRDDALVA